MAGLHILQDKPDLSQWSLKYEAFGRDIEFSWLARNMQPIPNQKIHWRSLDGLPNRGVVRFFPKGPSSCVVEVRLPLIIFLFVSVSLLFMPSTTILLCLSSLIFIGDCLIHLWIAQSIHAITP
ncbi:hypothetical protein ACSBR2_031603 [Camellia fascicularis]